MIRSLLRIDGLNRKECGAVKTGVVAETRTQNFYGRVMRSAEQHFIDLFFKRD